jgi:hypothetical protein
VSIQANAPAGVEWTTISPGGITAWTFTVRNRRSKIINAVFAIETDIVAM